MTPVNVSDITKNCEERLQNAIQFEDVQLTVMRSEEINDLPRACPWVGIYVEGVDYPVKTIGRAAGFRGEAVRLVFVIQEMSNQAGASCSDALNELHAKVLEVLFEDTTFGGNAQSIGEVSLKYESYLKKENVYMQTAYLYVEVLTAINY